MISMADPDDLPFSLTCSECDAGTDIVDYGEALGLGWVDVFAAPDLPMANYIGLCPECQRLLGEQQAREEAGPPPDLRN